MPCLGDEVPAAGAALRQAQCGWSGILKRLGQAGTKWVHVFRRSRRRQRLLMNAGSCTNFAAPCGLPSTAVQVPCITLPVSLPCCLCVAMLPCIALASPGSNAWTWV
jgi:hypothetical protein